MAEEVKKVTRKRWTAKEQAEAIKFHKVEGRTPQAVQCHLSKLGIKGTQKRKWTEPEIRLVQAGGFPIGRSRDAVYQLRHKLGVTVPCNKFADPNHPDQLSLNFKAERKNPPQHHHDSVNKLLLPIYTMYNGGMKVAEIAEAIHQSVSFVDAAIKMKTEFKLNG